MAAAPQVERALDPVERYFWILTEISDPRGTLFAYVDRTFDQAQLARALRAPQRRHPFLNVRIEVVDGEPVFVRVPGEIPVTVPHRQPGEPVPVGQVQAMPFAPPPHPLVRCVSAPNPKGEGSVLFVVVHHAFLDANATLSILAGGQLPTDRRGARVVQPMRRLDAAEHTVSSLGRIKDDGDPHCLRRLTPAMFPGSNQLCFAATTTYRGELLFNISTDAAKMAPETIDRFVADIAARTGGVLEQTTTCPLVGVPAPRG